MSIDLGAVVYVALKPVFKIYLILGMGYLLAKYNIVDVEASRSISNMVVNAILPCLVFNKVVGNIQANDIKEIAVIVLSALLLFCIGGVASMVIKFLLPVPKRWIWGLIFAGLFPNISDLPIAYVQSMGTGIIFDLKDVDKGVAYCCIFLITQSFLMMNFGMFRLVGLDFKEKASDEENTVSSLDQDSNDIYSSNNTACSLKEDKRAINSSGLVPSKAVAPLQATAEINHSEIPVRLSENEHADHESFAMTDLETQSESDLASYDQLEAGRPQSFRMDTANSNNFAEMRNKQKKLTRSRSRPHDAGASSMRSSLRSHSTSNVDRNNVPSYPQLRRLAKSRNRHRAQTINDVITEYSVADRVRAGELDLTRPLTLTADIGEDNVALQDSSESDSGETSCTSNVSQIPPAATSVGQQHNDSDNTSLRLTRTLTNKSLRIMDTWFQRHGLGWLEYIMINFFRPASLGALLGIVCSMIPWVQALFVHTYVHVHDAPDHLPVLNFFMDFTQYIGNACIPLGLLLLGGTIARLQITSLPPGFLTVAVAVAAIRLAIIPVIGVAWANKLYRMNWIESDIAKLVIILTFSMPSATAQVYFTAFFTPVDGPHLQMDCLSVLFVVQYILLFVTLPFVVTYTLKVDLKY